MRLCTCRCRVRAFRMRDTRTRELLGRVACAYRVDSRDANSNRLLYMSGLTGRYTVSLISIEPPESFEAENRVAKRACPSGFLI